MFSSFTDALSTHHLNGLSGLKFLLKPVDFRSLAGYSVSKECTLSPSEGIPKAWILMLLKYHVIPCPSFFQSVFNAYTMQVLDFGDVNTDQGYNDFFHPQLISWLTILYLISVVDNHVWDMGHASALEISVERWGVGSVPAFFCCLAGKAIFQTRTNGDWAPTLVSEPNQRTLLPSMWFEKAVERVSVTGK